MIRWFAKALLSVFDNFQGTFQHLLEPNELRAPEAECCEVDPGGGGGDGGHDGDVEDGGVPPVQCGEDHHPAQEEGDQHQEAIDYIGQTFLHIKMNQNDSGWHEGRAGLNQEAAAQEAVSVPVSEVHHGREPDDWHEDMMENDEWTVRQELLDLPLADGDPVFGEGGVDKIHWDTVVEEVRHPEDEIIVKNIESVCHDVSSALAVD